MSATRVTLLPTEEEVLREDDDAGIVAGRALVARR